MYAVFMGDTKLVWQKLNFAHHLENSINTVRYHSGGKETCLSLQEIHLLTRSQPLSNTAKASLEWFKTPKPEIAGVIRIAVQV